MSDLPKPDTLCRRCSLLSFDDAAIGGQEVVDEYGTARLSFPESKTELHPTEQEEKPYHVPQEYRLVRLDWKLDEILPDMPHLSLSSKLGCAFCQALRKSLEDALPKKAKSYSKDDGPLRLVAYLSLNGIYVEGLMIEGTIINARLNNIIQTLFSIEASPGCCEWLKVDSARITSYLDPTNIQQLHRPLDHCTSTCHPDTPSSFMPTRLLDIGHDVSALPRLVLSSNIKHPQETRYAALSYCWGTETDAKLQFKTEKASLESRYAGLPSELMTPTTNDAIALARAIGVPYLWIDALCIIQDDKDDWSYESSQMNLVYRHAFVTLCSLNSKSCHESFLSRAPAVKLHFQSTIRKAIKGFYLIRLRPRTGEYLDHRMYNWDSAFGNWNKRCWTFQEQEMSTRLLLFGNQKLHFACGRSEWAEGDEAPKEKHKSWSGVSDMIARFKDNCISSRELYEYWDHLVHQYGRRSVTFDKDRLPAIAGLARILGDVLQDQYLAGIWKGDLPCGLTWGSLRDHDSLSHSLAAHIRSIQERNYVAPSWSWAACPAVVSMRDQNAVVFQESTMVDVDTHTDSEDLYGQVSGGFLRIRGKIARMPDWLSDGKKTTWSNYWSHIFTDTCEDSIIVATDWLQEENEAGLESLIVMLLYRYRIGSEDRARALLLHPADELGNYYRVGVVMAYGSEAYREIRRWFDDSQEETICIV